MIFYLMFGQGDKVSSSEQAVEAFTARGEHDALAVLYACLLNPANIFEVRRVEKFADDGIALAQVVMARVTRGKERFDWATKARFLVGLASVFCF